ncbi:uncharacterized protein LOC121371623 [Gigantopelta aegis]|uniref:uncharacterized protein LOC121371623 n=1 Tax=Gigantopelta aegis TaxID=1735272 RepID=UPI001B888979|nr:uncharacterized protein LOC121371623 [Gigantopelta aegis]
MLVLSIYDCNCRMEQMYNDMRIKKALSDAMATNKATPLVKEELRLSILLKRMTEGKDEMVVKFNMPKKYELTDDEVVKRDRRRRQNRDAARKFRQNKKMKASSLLEIVEKEECRKKELEEEMQELIAEKRTLLAEIEGRFSNYSNTIASQHQQAMFALHTQIGNDDNDRYTQDPDIQGHVQTQFTDMDLSTYGHITPEARLTLEYEYQYTEMTDAQTHFTDMVLSTDGHITPEARLTLEYEHQDTEMTDARVPGVANDVQVPELFTAPSVGDATVEVNVVNADLADYVNNNNLSDLVTISFSDTDVLCSI